MQPCLSDSTIPGTVQLQTIVLYCRRNARFLVHTSPPRKFSECAARFLIHPALRSDPRSGDLIDLPQVYFQRAHSRHTGLREIYLQDPAKRGGEIFPLPSFFSHFYFAGARVFACWWVSGNRLVASLGI